MENTWYSAAKNAKGEADIYIYDEIGGWGVSAKQFKATLKSFGDVARINLSIHSPGGSIIEGNAIYNELLSHPAKVSVKIGGWAASMASVIAMAGDEIEIPSNAYLMIHNPWTVSIGDSETLRKDADLMDKMRESIVTAYQRHTDLSREDIIDLMNAETWMTGNEAVEKGFATSVSDALEVAAKLTPVNFKNAPEGALALLNEGDEPEPEEDEDAPKSPEGEETVEIPEPESDPEPEETTAENQDNSAADQAYDAGYDAGLKKSEADHAAKVKKLESKIADLNAKIEQAAKDAEKVQESHKAEVDGLNSKFSKLIPGFKAPKDAEKVPDAVTKWNALVENMGYSEARRQHKGAFEDFMACTKRSVRI